MGRPLGAEYDLEYAESYAAVSYAAGLFGPGKCLDALRYMKAGDNQETAVQKAFGIPLSVFEQDFRKWLPAQ